MSRALVRNTLLGFVSDIQSLSSLYLQALISGACLSPNRGAPDA